MTLPLRLHVPDSPDVGLLEFVRGTYALQNSRLASGSAASLEDYVTQVNNLQTYVNELLASEEQRPLVLSDLNDPLVAGCMKWLLSRGRANETCNKLRAATVAIVNFSIDELDMSLKRLRVKKFKVSKRKPQCWLPEEVLQILSAARRMPGKVGAVPAGDWFLALELFILNTGTRISAAMATPSACLDLEGGWVTIPASVQKHDSDEVFDLLPCTVAALRALHPARLTNIFDDWPYDRNIRQWRTLNRRQKEILVAAGLFPKTAAVTKRDLFHKLRRSFATFIAMSAGKDVSRDLMGHSHQSVTDRYLDPRMLRKTRVSDHLAGFLQPPTPPDPQKRLFD
jgi:integrase